MRRASHHPFNTSVPSPHLKPPLNDHLAGRDRLNVGGRGSRVFMLPLRGDTPSIVDCCEIVRDPDAGDMTFTRLEGDKCDESALGAELCRERAPSLAAFTRKADLVQIDADHHRVHTVPVERFDVHTGVLISPPQPGDQTMRVLFVANGLLWVARRDESRGSIEEIYIFRAIPGRCRSPAGSFSQPCASKYAATCNRDRRSSLRRI